MKISDYPIRQGRYLIEASAGTGKTWTLTHLFLRLVLNGVPVPKILVTTFSKAAAAELKERIVRVLDEELQSLDRGRTELPAAERLHRKLLLKLAVSSMDEMTIGTIHSFCQKMLREYTLDTDRDFAGTLIPDESRYRDRLVRAFFREKFYSSGAEEKVSLESLRKAAGIAAPPDARIEPGSAEKQYHHQVFQYVRERLDAEKEQDGVLSYDDLIRSFHDAVMTRPGLAAKIGQRYRAVFVDEFQDTDRMQFEIFDRCFPPDGDSLFYMIGDPKQAIYEFRGADIYTYLKAKELTPQDHRFHLTRNFRSSPDMIRAVNRIFSGPADLPEGTETPGVFLQDDIPFISVVPGTEENRFPSAPKSALRLRHYVGKKSQLDEAIYQDAVNEIAWLLSENCPLRIDEEKCNEHGETVTVSRPLRASDIAVLVPKHDQAAEFLTRLNRRGIAASACKSGKIFDSSEAEIMQLLLHCLLRPEPDCLRGLLLSPFCRLTAEQLTQPEFQDGPVAETLQALGAEWREHGLPSAFLHFLDLPLTGIGTPRLNLLSGAGGERAVTNYLQLMELLYEQETRNHLRPEEVLHYLDLAVNGRTEDDHGAALTAGSDDNPDQLRLDRDSAAVQLLTLFAAKGLEFPVVFLPFPVRTAGAELTKYDIVCKIKDRDGRMVLDFDKTDPDHRNFAWAEALRSQLRLLYVGLTRASYVTYLYTRARNDGESRGMNFLNSAQGVILTEPAAIPGLAARYYQTAKTNLPDPLTGWFDRLVRRHEQQWDVFEAYPARPASQLRQETGGAGDDAVRKRPFIPDQWRVLSFTGFKSLWDHTEEPENESPADLDAQPDDNKETLSSAPEPVADTTFRAFPRGRRVGTLVHEVFEKLAGQFSALAPDAPEPRQTAVRELIRQTLTAHGYAPEKLETAVWDGLARALRTPLPGLGIPLYRIQHYSQETEFFLDAEHSLDLHRILEILKARASVPVRDRLHAAVEAFPKHGLLNGLTDLIFEHESRYYIVDWKTNYLGSRDTDYTQEKVADAMIRERYVLQAYLYAAALLRQMRLLGIPDENFGGVFYLFPRGMEPGSTNGIWQDRPPIDCLDSLLKLFQGGMDR